MTLLPEVRQELYETAARCAAVPRRRWWPAAARALPVAVAVAVALVVLVVALVALKPAPGHPSDQQPAVSHGTPPPIPGPPPSGVDHYIGQAAKAVNREDRVCGGTAAYGGLRPRRGSFSAGSPPRAMVSAFSVLARPATKDDRRMIALFGRGRGPGDGFGVYRSAIREAQYRYGGGYFLVPVADANSEHTPVRCDREELTALRRFVAHAPRSVRARVLVYETRYLAARRYAQEHPDGICLDHLNDKGFGGGGCGETTYELEQGLGGGLTGGEGDNAGGFIEAGIIPDGVATITVHYAPRRRGRRRRTGRAFTATVPVVNNVAVIKLPPGVESGRSDRTITWRSATGALIPHAP